MIHSRHIRGKEVSGYSIGRSIEEANDFLRRFDSLDNPILPIDGFNQVALIRDLAIAIEAQMDDGFSQADEIAGFKDLLTRVMNCKDLDQAKQLIKTHFDD